MKTSPIREDGEVKTREDWINEVEARKAQLQSAANVKDMLQMMESILK